MFCESFIDDLQGISELEQLNNRLLIKLNDLKSQKSFNNGSYRFEELIINKIKECIIRAPNLLLYNIFQSPAQITYLIDLLKALIRLVNF